MSTEKEVLNELHKHEDEYEPSEETKQKLSSKILVSLIGPTAIGKSTLAQAITVRHAPRYAESNSVVTRFRRPSDPSEYLTADEGYDLQSIQACIKNRELTHYAVNPNGVVYANLAEGFPGAINLQPLLPAAITKVRKAGFKTVHLCYLYTDAATWQNRLGDRLDDVTFKGRVPEAIDSLEFALSNKENLTFIDVSDGQTQQGVDSIVQLVETGVPTSGSAPDELHELLAYAKGLYSKA